MERLSAHCSVTSPARSRRAPSLTATSILSFMIVVGAALLGGCATIPGVEITTLPDGVQQVTHPARKFAVEAPPAEWRLKSPEPGVDVSWEKNIPGQFAMLLVLSGQASPLPPGNLTDNFIAGFKGEPGASATFRDVTVTDEATVVINGKEARRVEMDMRCACKGTTPFAMKSAVYLLRAKEFDYYIFLLTFPQHYQADGELVERLLRSFRPLE